MDGKENRFFRSEGLGFLFFGGSQIKNRLLAPPRPTGTAAADCWLIGSRKVLWSALKFRVQLQRAVSMNKRRFVQAGGGGAGRLDLDLTYICDRLIAMAIPCVEGAVYRNDIREVSEPPSPEANHTIP